MWSTFRGRLRGLVRWLRKIEKPKVPRCRRYPDGAGDAVRFWRQVAGRSTVSGRRRTSQRQRTIASLRKTMSKSRVNLLSRSRIRKRIGVDRAANGGEWARDGFCIELGMLEAHLAGRLGSADNGTLW
jgi:hypothetical protein